MASLLGAAPKRSDAIHPVQSCALALPRLAAARPGDDTEAAAVGRGLLAAYRGHRDQQTRWFAAIGLGFLGGNAARTALLIELDRADKTRETPRLALALRVLERCRQDLAESTQPDATITGALRARSSEVRAPEARGALAVAFGLCRDPHAIQLLRDVAQDGKDDLAVGYACIGLAMIGDRDAKELVRRIVDRSGRRPMLLARAAIALGCSATRPSAIS
jgi:hypothetical protein